jgi:hypothetical protein
MDIQLSDKQMELIATTTARIILRKMKEEKEPPTEMVTLKEAARILHVSENHMRRIKDKYPYIKNGNNAQGHLLFVREALLKTYGQ